MPWWGWITVGAMLLLAEMAVVDLEFYLVFLGASALVTGLAVLAGLPLPYWGEWILFAALAAGSLVFFRKAVYRHLRPPPDHEIPEGVDGERAVATDAIAAGAMGPVTLRGTSWSARNVGQAEIAPGEACRVERADGLILEIRSEP